jgi:alpha-1,6-mannosyltransferase
MGRDPVFAALAVGLNPLVLVHVVGGAHNDAILVLLLLAAVLATLSARERIGGALLAAGTAVKISGGLLAPFMLVRARPRAALIGGALLAAIAIAAASFAAFGLHAFDALGLIGENQGRTSRWSIPQRSADGIAALTGGSPSAIVHFTRAAFALAFICFLALLLRRAWEAKAPSDYWLWAAGWATLALLLASAWLVPWYAIWLLPLAALSASRALIAGSLLLCAYMLVIAVPL